MRLYIKSSDGRLSFLLKSRNRFPDRKMLFSSLTFLLLFLPFTAVFYFVLPRAWRNTFLLVMSMFFYAWGEPRFLAVMLLEIATVWAGAAAVGAAAENGSERMQNILTALTVCTLVLILAVFKYLDFIIENIRLITGAKINPLGIVLPLGISFYTFQALSYVIDVRRGNVKAERNIHTVALYIALFPQLVAGPIIKYHEISAELRERETSMSDAADGVRRFIIGLGKKTLIANPLGEIADLGFSEDPASLAALPAWICAFAFTLQLFFDFSGYSDMAIGIGRIFGFHFPENFRYPFISRTISEFWRRWHISLSTWFRDYLYIPLGGSRKGLTRTILNLGFVFIVTGLWHGPTWTFVVWGAMNGALVIIERITGLNRERERPFLVSAALHVYCVLAFTLCFVVFNSSSIDHACSYFRAMAGLSPEPALHRLLYFTDIMPTAVMCLAAAMSTPLFSRLIRPQSDGISAARTALQDIFLLAVLVLSAASIMSADYNPFIYFRF